MASIPFRSNSWKRTRCWLDNRDGSPSVVALPSTWGRILLFKIANPACRTSNRVKVILEFSLAFFPLSLFNSRKPGRGASRRSNPPCRWFLGVRLYRALKGASHNSTSVTEKCGSTLNYLVFRCEADFEFCCICCCNLIKCLLSN